VERCDRYGKLDVLINNAGVMPISPLDNLRVDDWEQMKDVNIESSTRRMECVFS
jgi:NADP-dependent 3-hydroxy acid dehydrogenase YdfG